jgi:hypothetical protein
VSPRSVGALADRQIRMERAGDSRRKASGDAPRIRHVVARLGVALRATLFRAFAGCVDPHTGREVGGPRPRTDARMPCAGNLVGTLWWKLGIGDRGSHFPNIYSVVCPATGICCFIKWWYKILLVPFKVK